LVSGFVNFAILEYRLIVFSTGTTYRTTKKVDFKESHKIALDIKKPVNLWLWALRVFLEGY
jgi:hypothetical protein